MSGDYIIRKTRAEDIDAVVAIENQQFPHPWKKNFFLSELTHNLAYFYVLEHRIEHKHWVVGYIIFWVIKETIELHNIAVEKEHKGKGLGKRLFTFLIETAKKRNGEEIFLEVRQSNQEAIGFYEHQGFKQIATRKDYYNDPKEDAVIYKMLCGRKNALLTR